MSGVSDSFRRVLRLPSKLRRIFAAHRLSQRYVSEDPGVPGSDVPIEVLIPVIPKDLVTLPMCVESIRRFVRHPIRRIRLVARPDDQIRAVAARLDTPIVDEDSALSAEAKGLVYRVNGKDRSGWIRQQLIKLGADSLVETDRFLVIDADTAFARNIVFCRDGKDVLFAGDEYYRPYFDAYRRLTGMRKRFPLTFVTHHMLFNTRHLFDLRQTIARHTGRRWDLAMMDMLDPQNESCLSEYETYGNFCCWMRPNDVTVRYWHNKGLWLDERVLDLELAVELYGQMYCTVSCHGDAHPSARIRAAQRAALAAHLHSDRIDG